MARQIDLDQLMKYPLRRGSEHCDEKNADPRFLNGVESILEWAQTLPTLTPPNEWLTMEFDVVDTTTGKYPDWERIAREEAWAKGLVYCDMDGIAIREDGSLILLDECGNCVSCPPDRFEIRRPPEGEGDNND